MSEICFNLWYFLDAKQNVVGVCAREYCLEGSDDEMGQILMALSKADFRLVDVTKPSGQLHYSKLQQLGIDLVFDQEFHRIQQRLPAGVVLPDEKFFLVTPLFNFGSGFVSAVIGNGFVRERDV